MKSKFLFCLAILFIFVLGSGDKTFSQGHKLSGVLNIYNWEDYFSPEVLKSFENEFGIKVNLTTFKDEEEMISKIQAYPEKYDLIVTSDDTVSELILMRLLARIDLNNIPNIKNIGPNFLNHNYDPGNQYSVPYLWGTSGLAVNREFIKENIDSWAVLWNPRYRGKIAMLNNPNEVISAALKYLGYSLNEQDSAKLQEAQQKLLEQKPLIAGYLDPIELRDKLAANEIWAAQIYSGEGMQARDKNKNIEYVIPKEGATIWLDSLAIPRDARHKYTAEIFINYILDPKKSAQNADYLCYANCNLAARQFTSPEIINNSSLYPAGQILKKCEFILSVGSDEARRNTRQLINKIWARLQLIADEAGK